MVYLKLCLETNPQDLQTIHINANFMSKTTNPCAMNTTQQLFWRARIASMANSGNTRKPKSCSSFLDCQHHYNGEKLQDEEPSKCCQEVPHTHGHVGVVCHSRVMQPLYEYRM